MAGDLYDTSYPWYKDNILIMSGLIPRSHNYTKLCARLFGKRLNSDGSIIEQEVDSVDIVKNFYRNYYSNKPKNAIMWQNLTNYSTPYPALLYGKGTWPMIDLAFFLHDTPMTFLNEISGYGYRLKGIRYFKLKNENKIYLLDPKAKFFKDQANPGKLTRIDNDLLIQNQQMLKENETLQIQTISQQKQSTSSFRHITIVDGSFCDIPQEELELFIDPDEEHTTFNYNQLWNCDKSASEVSSFDELKKNQFD